MALTAYDSATDFTKLGLGSPAHDVKNAGYDAVGIYLRGDRCSKAMIDQGHEVGLKFFSCWEKGNPTSYEYFTTDQATQDANDACGFAQDIGMPQGLPIFFAYDGDLNPSEVAAYVKVVHEATTRCGYLASGYGSGAVLGFFIQAGYMHSGWLAGASGWSGYAAFKGQEVILQGSENLTVLGMACDADTVIQEDVCW